MEAPASTFYPTTEPVTLHTQFQPFETKEDELKVKVDSLACQLFKGAVFVACVGLGIYLSPIAFTATFIAASAISFYYFSGYAKERATSIFNEAERAQEGKRQETQWWKESKFTENAVPQTHNTYKHSISYVENSITRMRSVDVYEVALAVLGPLMAFDVLCVASGILPGLAAGKIAADTYYSWKAEKECGPILADLKIPVQRTLLPAT